MNKFNKLVAASHVSDSDKDTILDQLDWLLVNDAGHVQAVVCSGEFYALDSNKRHQLLQAVRASKVVNSKGQEVPLN